jgi:hypothetical protein
MSALALMLLSLVTPGQDRQPALRVYLDCSSTNCYADYVRAEVTFVDFVRERTEADVHVIVTSTETGSGGREYTGAFIGLGALTGVDHSLKAVTTSSDPEDVIRRQIATMVRIGVLGYMARRGTPQTLDVQVELDDARPAATGAAADPWNYWVFSLRGSASFQGEESTRETSLNGSISADRITPDWKLTFAAELDHENERFDLDEDEPVSAERREREFRWLVVKGLGEHWSVGAEGDVESSTFSNTELGVRAAPAVEFNVFPYSAYTRRQLRFKYAIGGEHAKYSEETIYGKTEETLPAHEVSVAFEQRERWGSVDARLEWFQYLHDLEKYRLEADAEISWRLARGLSISAEASGSRIRDQLSLPRRGATDEEILLRLRELESGYEYDFQVSVTYTFGSIFSSIVNPRFGQ